MNLDFPKLIRGINLADYAPEYQATIQVWVNPPRALVAALSEAVKNNNETPDDLKVILVDLWSQSDDKWTIDDINKFIENCDNTDPALLAFAVRETIELIGSHRQGIKKKQSAPLSS